MISYKNVVAIVVAVAILAFAGGVEFTRTVTASSPAGGHVARRADTFQATFPLLQEVYNALMQDYVTQPSSSSLIRGAIDGMTGSLGDPYTEYYDPQQYQELMNELNGQFSGIGVEIQQVGQYIVVESVLPNSPALKAGIQVGDRIVTVDGQSLIGVSADDAANKIRGPQGSEVHLAILRGTATLKLTITRAPIVLPTVETKTLPGGIAYLQLNQVSQDAASEFTKALNALLAAHPKGLILDLRDDPGGLVDQAVAIAQQMIPSGPIVEFKGRVDNEVYRSNSGKTLHLPTVVLVNSGTASAAEIITGALQDDGLATVIGTRTFGKGIAQEIVPMQNGGVLKVTVAKWYTPKGRNIELSGLTPDQYVDGQIPALVYAENLLGDHIRLVARYTVGSQIAYVNGVRTVLDTAPTRQGTTDYLSSLAAEQLLGVNVVPDPNNQSVVTLHYDKHTLVLTIAQSTGDLDGRSVPVVAPMEENGIVLIPLPDLLRLAHFQVSRSGSAVTLSGTP